MLRVLGKANARCSWSLIISIIVVAAIGLAAWFLSPKGENQTYAIPFLCMAGARPNVHKYSVWRSTIILSTASCWLMWGMDVHKIVFQLTLTSSQRSRSSHNGTLSSYPNEAISAWKLSRRSVSKQDGSMNGMARRYEAFRRVQFIGDTGIRPGRARKGRACWTSICPGNALREQVYEYCYTTPSPRSP